MKQGVSSLNPYAAAYIPLSKRGVDDTTFMTTNESNEAFWSENPQHCPQDQLHYKASLECDAHGAAKQVTQGVYAAKSDCFYGSSSQTVNEMAEKQMSEEFDMDLEYLRMTFSGISDQSLIDVYLANNGDLEASIDMLNQLEGYPVDSSESLPDTLDIGDVSEFGSTAHSAQSKRKHVPSTAEASYKASDSTFIS